MNAVNQDLSSSKLIKDIVKNYNTLDYVPKLRSLLDPFYPELESSCKYDLHKKINEIIIDGHQGEQVLKYRLFRAFQNANLVAAFEIRVLNSRVDFLTVNGHTTSYEIKSNLDNLDKLAKQSADYIGAFEFNNIVIDKKHLKKCYDIIPSSFGIITVDKLEHTFVRKPIFNRALSPDTQLSLLTKKEMLKWFGKFEIADILCHFSDSKINDLFKLALKARYRVRWNFIIEHADSILPIDLQFFFNKNINPIYIYS